MSGNDRKNETSVEPHKEVSGTAGLERTSGTTSTSTGVHERTSVAPAMPDTGDLHQTHTSRDDQRLKSGSELGINTRARELNTISPNKQSNQQHLMNDLK